MPPTVGFWGKLYLLSAAVQSGRLVLAGTAALSSLLGSYCCLRIAVDMYRPAGETSPIQPRPVPESLSVLLLTFLAALGLGLSPAPVIDAARVTVISIM